MQIRVGFEMVYEFAARTPVVLMLNVHPSRASDVIQPDQLRIAPALPVTRYLDAFANVCTRLVAPAGELKISTDALIADSGLPDAVERRGVCRDFAHLAITLCRCMNIPARYCTGYLGDIGVAPEPEPMDFSAWFEVYLGGRWYAFDARHNVPRIGRIVMARGRDAADVAFSTTFGPNVLKRFAVHTDEAAPPRVERMVA